MKVKELIHELLRVDEDIMEYEVGAIVSVQITKEVRLSARTIIQRVQENADVDQKILWLNTKPTGYKDLKS